MSYEDRKYYSHLITPSSVFVVFTQGPPVSLTRTDDNAGRYDYICDLLRSAQYEQVPSAVDKALAVATVSRGKFNVRDGSIVIDGHSLPGALSDKLLDLVDTGEDTTSLENFWDNLKDNPTENSREDLFSFLSHNNVPITRDGCFIVYKKVKDDYWDSYTGKTHQSIPGTKVTMEREKVDPNRNNTCSAGLHVAAFEYANNFSGTKLLECKVNPRDVVAVPPDYSNQKMRVCCYEVLRETTEKYSEATYTEDKPTDLLGAGVFKPLRLALDARWRLRLPGNAIRRIGAGVGAKVTAFVDHASSRNVKVVFGSVPSAAYAESDYTVDGDNAIRISNTLLEKAKLDGYAEYEVKLKDGALEIRAV